MTEHKNYYEVLDLTPEATEEDIRDAYIKAKNSYSGDNPAFYSILGPEDCERILNEIEEAYSVLGVHAKRIKYDKAKGFETPMSIKNQSQFVEPSMHQEFNYDQDHSMISQATVNKVTAIKKYKLQYKQDHDFEHEIENQTNFTGAFLKKIREYKQVSIEKLAEMTRISKTYIKIIENDEYDKLPAEVYARGFIFQYAKTLKLNADFVAQSYMNRYKESRIK